MIEGMASETTGQQVSTAQLPFTGWLIFGSAEGCFHERELKKQGEEVQYPSQHKCVTETSKRVTGYIQQIIRLHGQLQSLFIYFQIYHFMQISLKICELHCFIGVNQGLHYWYNANIRVSTDENFVNHLSL